MIWIWSEILNMIWFKMMVGWVEENSKGFWASFEDLADWAAAAL